MKRLVLAAAVLGCASMSSYHPSSGAAGVEPEVAAVERRDSSCFSPYLTDCVEGCAEHGVTGFDACRRTCERHANTLCPR